MLPVRTDSILSRSPDRISRFQNPRIWTPAILFNPHSFSSLSLVFNSVFTESKIQKIKTDYKGCN